MVIPNYKPRKTGKRGKMTQHYKEVKTSQHEVGQEQRVASMKATQLIWWLLGFFEAVLALRFVFKLIGVNAANPFASFLYNISDFLVKPFASLTGAPAANGMVFEISTLLAMIIYGLIGWGIVKLVYVLFYRPPGPISTSQTTVSDHTPDEATSESSQTTTTTTEHKDN
ncbi:MAG: YggT family protein [Anaerolineales bacterium]|nr:YggT family protein [Anaerolineales bacterium]